MKPLPIPPHSLPGFEPLMNGELWLRWHSDGIVFPVENIRAACKYLRFKPDATCRIFIAGVDHHTADEPPQGYMLHLYPDAGRADVAYAKEMSKRHTVGSDGHTPFLCEESAVVGIPYPNDPEIPDLRHLYSPDRFRRTLNDLLDEYPEDTWRIQRSLTKLTLLNYKPGRRAVYRIKVKLRRRVGDEKVRVRLHVKVENPRTCDRSFENLQKIHDAIPPSAPWRVPSPRGQAERRTLMGAEWVEGSPLRDVAAQPGAEPVFRRVGAALASFHRLPVELDHLLSPVEEGDRLIQHSRDLAGLLPDRKEEILALGEELACQISRLSLSPSAPVHGDFHVDQVLIAGDRPVIVDLDRSGLGYAATDLGSFMAHLDELEISPKCGEAFLRGYQEEAGASLPREWLQVTRAAAIFRRAGFPFRELREEWPAEVTARLEATARQLDGLGR